MHDIDRVLLEHPEVAQEDEDELFLFEDELLEQEHEHEQQFLEHEQFFEHEDEQEHEHEQQLGEHEHMLTETQEVELANQVLEIASEQELEQFLGDFLRVAADRAGRFARSKTGRQLGGILKNAAVQALPVVGRAVAGPTGARVGRSLASAARCFDLSQEAMSGEDREFELARHYVRFADCATRQALRRFNSAPPQQVARHAVTAAARIHAPGLPLPRVLAAAPVRRVAMTSVAGPASSRPASNAARPASNAARPASNAALLASNAARPAAARRTGGPRPDPEQPAVRCTTCGSPLTTTSGRWVLRGNAVVLLPD